MKNFLIFVFVILTIFSCNKKPSESGLTNPGGGGTVITTPNYLLIDVLVLNQPFTFSVTDWTTVSNGQTIQLASRTLPTVAEIKIETILGAIVIVSPPDAQNIFNVSVTSEDHSKSIFFKIAWEKLSFPTDNVVQMIGLNILKYYWGFNT